jgi:hypothetical protein
MHAKKTFITLFSTFCAAWAVSPSDIVDVNVSRLVYRTEDTIALPFVFSSDSTGFSGGAAYIRQGLLQPHTTFIASIFGGLDQDVIINGNRETKNFKGAFLFFNDYRLPGTERTFASFMGVASYFPKATYYFNGGNDSKENDKVVTPGETSFAEVTLEYVLPLGEGIDNPEGHYRIENGFVVDREEAGGGVPFVTGRTTLGLEYFYQYNDFENDFDTPGHIKAWESNGLRFFVQHDNTDFDIDPSRGYQFQLRYSRDFGWGDALQTWDFLEFKYNHYIPLSTFSWTRRNVLATSLWTGYSFSWDKDAPQVRPGIDAHRPPMWEGARLGGLFRMRAYDSNRFSDRAVFYASAEYRATLVWNPFRKGDYLPVPIDWIQIVPFFEVGRVNDDFDADLLKDLKYDGGVSFRMMAAQVPVRFDIAIGDEGTGIWAMVYHPFDF